MLGRDTGRLDALELPAGTLISTRLEDLLDNATMQAVLVLTPPNTTSLNFTGGSATLETGEFHAERLDGRTFHAGNRQASGSGASMMAFNHQAHRAVLQDFVAAIRNQTAPAVTGRSALQVHRLIAALMASSASAAAVSLTTSQRVFRLRPGSPHVGPVVVTRRVVAPGRASALRCPSGCRASLPA